MRRSLQLGTAIAALWASVLAGCASTAPVESTADSATSSITPSSVAPAEPVDSSTSASTTTTVVETTTTMPSPLDCALEVPLEIRIGQLLFPVVVQNEMAAAADLAERGALGGVVVLGNPTESIAAEIETYQQRSLLGPGIIAVDEEGGRVQRLDELTSALPSARRVADELTIEAARQLARDHAEAIGALGFTMNLAPVADLDNGSFIRDRSFGADPDVVIDYAFATADGILDAGLTPVVKHFPGHGRGDDSHVGLPTLPDLETLRADDLIPFVQAAERGDLPIMIGHLVVPGLTNGLPATLSPEAVDGLLRTELGFDGLVMTDALNMDAISDTTSNAEAAELAIAAGVDLVMLGRLQDADATIERIVDAVVSGRLDEAQLTTAFLRVLEARGLRICALPDDIRPAIGCDC